MSTVTSAEINALPEHIRGYISALETEADPAGTIRQNILVREENEMLRRLVAENDAEAAWQAGYRAGVDDERTSEDNIGIAGMGGKIEPARVNPYTTRTF